MTISSVINAGTSGVQRSQQSMQQSAQQIASAATPPNGSGAPQNLIEPVLNIQQEQQVFDASARVIQVGSETLGSLLDIKA